MTRPYRHLLVALLLVGGATHTLASPKPCRDSRGRVVACGKSIKTSPARCKDASGRYVKCDAPGAPIAKSMPS